MKRAGIHAVSRPLRYRMKEITLSTGQSEKAEVAQEKGIDIRIALDIFKLTIENELDVAVIFSQDQDLAEVATEVKLIAKQQNRWVKISSAFPAGTNASCNYGIHGTDWIKIDQAMYDACLDARDYRPKISPSLSAASTPSTLATPAN